jgi:hypothetical protein
MQGSQQRSLERRFGQKDGFERSAEGVSLNNNEKIRSETTCVGGFWAIFGCFGSVERKNFPWLV